VRLVVGPSALTPVAFLFLGLERGYCMYLCYVDESGTPDIPGNTSHFVLAGLSIPVWYWKKCDQDIAAIKARYDLEGAEIHTAWILRWYLEQDKVADFDSLDHLQRRYEVGRIRTAELLRLQRAGSRKRARYRQQKKNYRKTDAYIHLSHGERKAFIRELAQCVSKWRFARLFAECINKVHFDPARVARTVDEQAFEQVVSRFEQYLQMTRRTGCTRNYGLLIHDKNETVASKHTQLMKRFHQDGTFWTNVASIIETPLFVDSELTGMVQIADLCAYALRRYLENDEEDLFDLVFKRADRKSNVVVGARHFTDRDCCCKICMAHRQ